MPSLPLYKHPLTSALGAMRYRIKIVTAHICAILSLCSITCFAFLWFAETTVATAVIDFLYDSLIGRILSGVTVVWIAVIWIWMTTSFFMVRPSRSPIAWGWFLFVFHLLAAPFYFYFVYVRESTDGQ